MLLSLQWGHPFLFSILGHILPLGGRSFHKDGQIQSGQTGFRCQILKEKQIQGKELEWTKFDEIIFTKFKQIKAC